MSADESMPDPDLLNATTAAVKYWRDGRQSFATLVDGLEYVVFSVERADPEAGQHLRSVWGELEIINALALERGVAVEDADLTDVEALCSDFVKRVERASPAASS